MIGIDLCSRIQGAVRSGKADEQRESHQDSCRYHCPTEYLLLPLLCALHLDITLCTFQKPINMRIEFVFGLTRLNEADPVCLQELLQLWQAFPRAPGERH